MARLDLQVVELKNSRIIRRIMSECTSNNVRIKIYPFFKELI